MADKGLPSYRRPPVVETVLGVQFQAIPGLTNAHLGAFWGQLEGKWPTVADAPTLDPVYERFDAAAAWRGIRAKLTLTSDPAARLQIRNDAGDAMIQVQNGRLHFNWLGHGGSAYPRYTQVRPRFDAVMKQFVDFLRGHALGELLPSQWEVTYVNHIPKGTVWSSTADWPGLFPGLPGIWSPPSAVRLETFNGAWRYEIEPQRGRLHIEIGCVRAGSPQGLETLRLTLTARGPACNQDEVAAGLYLGREVIVRTFTEITSPKAHEYWGRER